MATRASEDLLAFPGHRVRRVLRDHQEVQEAREIPATEASRAHRVPLARRGRTVCLVSMEKMALPASQGSRAAQGRLADPALPVTRVQQVCLEAQEQRADLELGERLDLEVMLGRPVHQDLRASLVFLVRLVWRAFLDPRVTEVREDQLGHRESWARVESREREDPWVSQVLRASPEPRATRASKEKSVQRATLVTPVWRDWLGRKVKRVLVVNPVPKDSKECVVILDTTALRETLANRATRGQAACPALGDSTEREAYRACQASRDQRAEMRQTSIS